MVWQVAAFQLCLRDCSLLLCSHPSLSLPLPFTYTTNTPVSVKFCNYGKSSFQQSANHAKTSSSTSLFLARSVGSVPLGWQTPWQGVHDHWPWAFGQCQAQQCHAGQGWISYCKTMPVLHCIDWIKFILGKERCVGASEWACYTQCNTRNSGHCHLSASFRKVGLLLPKPSASTCKNSGQKVFHFVYSTFESDPWFCLRVCRAGSKQGQWHLAMGTESQHEIFFSHCPLQAMEVYWKFEGTWRFFSNQSAAFSLSLSRFLRFQQVWARQQSPRWSSPSQRKAWHLEILNSNLSGMEKVS